MDKNNILVNLSESDKTQFGRQDFAEQSLPQRVFSALWALESEVNNGGFSQYFLNGSGETAWFVVEALETIAAPKTAAICKQAIRTAFPDGLPRDGVTVHDAAGDFLDATLEELDALDQEFFAYPNDLTELLFAYVRKHPEEFGELETPDDL
jgi:hypothetical protein